MKDMCEKFTDGDWIESKDKSESGIRLVQTGNVGVTHFGDDTLIEDERVSHILVQRMGYLGQFVGISI